MQVGIILFTFININIQAQDLNYLFLRGTFGKNKD